MDEVVNEFIRDLNDNDDSYWDDRITSIEFKISRQGQMIVGLAVGVGATLLLSIMQGKVVVNLVKGHKSIVEAINLLVSTSGNTDRAVSNSNVSYANPEKVVDTSNAEPYDPELAADLATAMQDVDKEPLI